MSFPIATILMALAALATLLALVVGLIYAIGRFVHSVEGNTTATEKLTVAFETHSAKTDETLVDHEVRISVLENQPSRK